MNIDLSKNSKSSKSGNDAAVWSHHYPVMHDEVKTIVEKFIKLRKGTVKMLDCTVGTGQHSMKLLSEHANLVV